MSSYAEKIAKIIAKADSTTNPAEADSFMAKAHSLMVEHGLSMVDLGKMSDDPVDMQADALDLPKNYRWMRRVASALAKYYGCDFVTQTRGSRELYQVAGRESARITFCLMMPYVIRQVRALGREGHKAGLYTSGAQADTRIGNALSQRIWNMVPQTERHHGNGVNALVPVDLIQQLIDAQNPKAPRKSKATTDIHAVGLAERVNINRQTEGETVKRIAS